MSTSDPAITIPTSITIPAGSVSQQVPFQIGAAFNPSHVFSVQAQLGTETETAYGTQATRLEGFTMYLAFTSYTVAGGQTTPDYLLNLGSVEGYSTTVQLQCMGLPVGASCLLGDSQITLTGYGAITSLTIETSSSVPAGTYTFTVNATDGTISRQATGTLVVVQGPALQITPASLSFPMQTVGTTSSPQTVTVTNSGGATMKLSVSLDGAITPDPNFAETNNCGGSLDAGKSCAVTVSFTPTVTGSVSGAVNVDANILGPTRQDVNLIGTAEGKLLKLSTSSLNFNTQIYVGQTSPAQPVTVWNTGTVPINFSGITITGTNAADFVLAPGTECSVGAQLGVGFGCTINVTFAPSASGTRSATLDIADDVSGSPQSVNLSGSASPPDFTMGPAPGTPSSVTVTAGGSATFTIAVAPLGAFNQSVTLSCPGAPLEATCSVSPSSVTLSGSGPQNVTVTVTTMARSTAMPPEPFPPTTPPRVWWVTLALVALNLFAWWLELRAPLGQPWRHVSLGTLARVGPNRAVALGSILLAVTLWASCGGGGSSAAPSSPGTPPGNYGMIVNGTSGNLSHSTTLTLVVK
ncbi:MAG: choice-of-anchor D domain-containing protein [Acidobacteria bacterium]|nr:MAG: choice-of-anchor D domain-containing protein [Acidobacteriota bacterium]